jgi:hypothetical protein
MVSTLLFLFFENYDNEKDNWKNGHFEHSALMSYGGKF